MIRSFAVSLVMLLFVSSAHAQPLVVHQSKFTVKETMDRLASELGKRGITVVARLDHAAGAQSVGMKLAPTEVMIFGNPKLGTPLMLAAPSIAIDLPMRLLAWQDSTGKVWIGYTAPDLLKERHGISDHAESFKVMAGALDSLARSAAGQ